MGEMVLGATQIIPEKTSWTSSIVEKEHWRFIPLEYLHTKWELSKNYHRNITELFKSPKEKWIQK